MTSSSREAPTKPAKPAVRAVDVPVRKRRAIIRWIRGWPAAAIVGLVACAVLMAPLLFFGAFSLRASLAELNARMDEDREGTAALSAGLLSRGMASRSDQLLALASRADVADALVRRDGTRLVEMFVAMTAGHPDMVTVGALDESGRLVARYPVDQRAIGQSLADGDYFTGAIATTVPFIGSVVRSRIDPSLVLVPIGMAVREGNVLRGVVALTIRPSLLAGDIAAIGDTAGREMLVADASGATIMSTAGRAPLGNLGLPRGSLDGLASVDGQPRVFTALSLRGTGWTLYVLDDPATIYDAQRELVSAFGGPLVVAVLGAGALAAMLAAVLLLLIRSRESLAAANVRLVQMNSEVESATRAKSEFLANMSHELRTPLNSILGFSDILAGQLGAAMSERQTRYLRNIHDAGDHLLRLINDVLDLSKVEAQRIELHRETSPLGVVLAPVLQTAVSEADKRGLVFECESPEDLAVHVDPLRVRQILLNLVSNATKFTPRGGTVSLRAAVADDSLVIEVADTGIGIPADKVGRVFGAFERLHEGRYDAQGTGLGLALAKRLVELHGGTIDFTTAEGRGTRFVIRLPQAVVPMSGDRVLVVEDESRDAQLISALAKREGLATEVAGTVSAALSAIRRRRPIAMVLDLRLPDGRGETVLEELRRPGLDAVPTIVVTVEDDAGLTRLAGADDHLTKPIDHERLAGWLRQIARRIATSREEHAGAGVAG